MGGRMSQLPANFGNVGWEPTDSLGQMDVSRVFFSKQACEEWFAYFIDAGLRLLIFTYYLLFKNFLLPLSPAAGQETAHSPPPGMFLSLPCSRVVRGWEC